LSVAGKGLNFDDPRSKLFFEFVRLIDECKPKYFLLENVLMKKEYEDIITRYMGVEPIMINSALVSAQNRKRLYWTNIPGVTQPEDRGILLKDIVLENTFVDRNKSYCIDANYHKGGNAAQYFEKSRRQQVFDKIKEYIVPVNESLVIIDKEVERGKVGYFKNDSHANRVYYIHGKAVTLLGEAGGGAAKMGQYLFSGISESESQILSSSSDGLRVKQATKKGYDIANLGDSINFSLPSSKTHRGRVGKQKAQTLDTQCNQGVVIDPGYVFGCITPDRINKRQNGQRFSDGEKFYTLTAQDQHGILTEGYIRKLTPVECERLQTLPDGYTEGISNTQRYRGIGNGWTVDVIAHILSYLPEAQTKKPERQEQLLY
ncbi:hypothetical protein EOM86_13845, partial [Candidatus Nomurabacteria bacterium]|nr:hypothetical protein [Candidatus Nomurabacteria bacterium]